MATIQKSLRIQQKILKEVENIAKVSRKNFGSTVNELLEEAIKAHRCPGIVFTEGIKGKRARIAGTGIEVWEVIMTYKGVMKDFKRLKEAYHWITEQQLKSALGYYELYPEEIDTLIAENESLSQENIQRDYPFLVAGG